MELTVREIQKHEIEKVVDYFVHSDDTFLKGMGADKSKLPNRTEWIEKLKLDFKKPNSLKEFYYVIWLIDNQPVGHSNVNYINFEESALMHLHLWKRDKRNKGLGLEFLKLSIPYYFKHLKLETLICEPYAKNIAPNKTLKKLGFKFIKAYDTVPSPICFKQTVNRYELTKHNMLTLGVF